MRVGVLQFYGWRDRSVPLGEIYRRQNDRVGVMDQTGYDCVWLAEHHFTGYSVCPSVHVMAAHVAARTERLRIGTAVTLAALYHPLRIAEEVALLDHLSDGRINWGAGRGFDPREFTSFGVEPENSADQFREAVEMVVESWKQEKVSFDGRFHKADGVEVLPKPVQKPYPPTWVAASSKPALDWAGAQGFSVLMDPHSPASEIARKRGEYMRALADAGHSTAGRVLPMGRLVAVEETDEKAREVAHRAAKWTLGAYVSKEMVQHFSGGDETVTDPMAHYIDQVIIHGSPEKVVDRLKQLEAEIPLEYLLLSPLSERTFSLFTDKVLPHVLG